VLGLVRIFLGIVALAGLVHLARQLPPLISARRALQQRMSNSARYSAWRGGAARNPDLLDRTEAEIIGARLQRLALIGVAVIVALLVVLFAPGYLPE
jgi:hypothetical protein